MTHGRCSSVSSAMTKRQAMAADSSGSENNQAGKLNAGASKKRPVISNILNSYSCICSQYDFSFVQICECFLVYWVLSSLFDCWFDDSLL